MDTGGLVADELVMGIVRERLASADTEKGYILDGFLRNARLAVAPDELLSSEERIRSIAPFI